MGVCDVILLGKRGSTTYKLARSNLRTSNQNQTKSKIKNIF